MANGILKEDGTYEYTVPVRDCKDLRDMSDDDMNLWDELCKRYDQLYDDVIDFVNDPKAVCYLYLDYEMLIERFESYANGMIENVAFELSSLSSEFLDTPHLRELGAYQRKAINMLTVINDLRRLYKAGMAIEQT